MILRSPGQLTQPASRIVSLVPSQTELLHFLGLENQTIGITKFCIHPREWFDTKIRVGGTKSIDIQKIKEINPDLIIANKEENVKEQVEVLAADFPVWITDVNSWSDARQMVLDIGELTGKSQASLKLVQDIGSAFFKLQATIPIRACYLIWEEPIMVAASGTFINDMMSLAGFENVFAGEERYPVKTFEQIREAKPEFILLSSEPYPFKEKHLQDFRDKLPGSIPILVDGEMFSWYGSRLLKVPVYFQALRTQVKSLKPHS